MAFQRVPYTFDVTVNWIQNGIYCLNTFYVQVDDTDYSQATCEDLASSVDGWVYGYLKTAWASAVQYVVTNVRGLNAQEDFQASNANSVGTLGTYTLTDPMPNNVAFSITRSTGLTGRTARGRVYMPLAVAMLTADENVVTAAWYDAAKAALDAFRTHVSDDIPSAVEVVVSRYLNGAQRAEAAVRAVTGYAASDLRVDTMRRRLS